MTDYDRLLQNQAAQNWQRIEDRITHLERLEGSTNAPISGNSLSLSIVTKTANYTITVNDFNILGDATASGITFTLPTAAASYDSTNNIGKIFNIMKSDAGPNSVTVQAAGAELIYSTTTPSGANSLIILNPLESMTIQSNGTSFYVW